MAPTIRPGSHVMIRRTGLDEIQCGDIVLVRTGSGLRLHRLVSRINAADGVLLITRGDNDMEPDPPVSASQLLGIFAGLEKAPRFWGRVSHLLACLFRPPEQA